MAVAYDSKGHGAKVDNITSYTLITAACSGATA